MHFVQSAPTLPLCRAMASCQLSLYIFSAGLYRFECKLTSVISSRFIFLKPVWMIEALVRSSPIAWRVYTSVYIPLSNLNRGWTIFFLHTFACSNVGCQSMYKSYLIINITALMMDCKVLWFPLNPEGREVDWRR